MIKVKTNKKKKIIKKVTKKKIIKKVTKKKIVKKKATKKKIVKKKATKKKVVKKKLQIKEVDVSLLDKLDLRRLTGLIKKKQTTGYIEIEDIKTILPQISTNRKYKNQVVKFIKDKKLDVLGDLHILSEKVDILRNERYSGKKSLPQPKQDAVQMYLKDIGRYPLLKPEEEIELSKRIKKNDKEAREKMVLHNLRLAVSFAKKYMKKNSHLTLLDLIQEATNGLYKAVDRFDHRLGYKFSTYACCWIRQSITRAIADQQNTIRRPVHMTETINKYLKVTNQLQQDLGRQPLVQEIANEMGISTEKIDLIKKTDQQTRSLDQPIKQSMEDDTISISEIIPDDNQVSPFDFAAQSILKEKIGDDFLDILTPKERKIIELRYGIKDNKVLTLEQIGREFNVTRERVRQVESKALEKLKEHKNLKYFKNY